MRITELRLKAGDLANQREYYAHILHLPVIAEKSTWLAIQVGGTKLVFEHEDGWRGRYHFAFDVPENQIEDAKAWITRRTSLAKLDGADVFESKNWNAHNLYFYDAAGNILEFIARHNQPNASSQPFTERSLLYVSEIGLATDDVPATVADLNQTLGLDVYDGAGSDTFTAVGDEDGLFIVVKRGRVWYPNTGIRAEVLPVSVALANGPEAGYDLPGLPYSIRKSHVRQSLSPAV
ncbi:MAG: glyoxalase/bleomycin resistance/dioxygenase family protein [Anaerolineae bacterium]|nr:glyoxalase/bleomycin resistance/dioxygenase family protein [Anaerolineae bacterium]